MCEGFTARGVVTIRSLAVDCGSKQFVTFHHKTAFDIPGAKNVTFFSKILNCKFLVLCFVLCWSRCVMVSCTRKRKCDGQLGPCHIYAMFRRSCTHFYQWVWPCVHNKTIKNEFMNSTTTNTGAHSPCASPIINRICIMPGFTLNLPEKSSLPKFCHAQQHPNIL